MIEENHKNNDIESLLGAEFGKAMDDFAALVARDDGTVFGNDGERKGVAFGWNERERRLWRKSRVCVFPGCKNKTIDSHTLQKGGPLKAVSEAKQVLTPRMDLKQKGLTMARIGIGEASIFPGFCASHELLFSEFEQHRELKLERDFALQTFRAICREMVRVKFETDQLDYSAAEYKKAVSQAGIKALTEEFYKTAPREVEFNIVGVQVEGVSNSLKRVEEAIARGREMTKMLRSDFFEPVLLDVQETGEGLAYFHITLEEPLPVCLSGFGNFYVAHPDRNERVNAILSVWPTDKRTHVIMAVPKRHEAALATYMATYLNRSLGILTMIETWMVNGTDHWFITPSVWEKLPKKRQKQIFADILSEKHSIGEPYPHSIFDEIRKRNIEQASSDDHPDEIERERKKLLQSSA